MGKTEHRGLFCEESTQERVPLRSTHAHAQLVWMNACTSPRVCYTVLYAKGEKGST